jgi:hypothetical protein
MNLKSLYGTCIIPFGTILFNSSKEVGPLTYRFFGLKLFVAQVFHQYDRRLLAYRVKKEFEVLFMLKELSQSGRYTSSGDEIFRKYFPDYPALVDDLSIKQDLKQRTKMIEILDSQNIVGWLNSLENKKELEIFIFGDNQMLENLIEPITLQEEDYRYYDALNFITIKPSQEFITKSKSNFSKNYTQYANDMNTWAEDLVCNESYSKEQAVFELYDLRMKLQI